MERAAQFTATVLIKEGLEQNANSANAQENKRK